MRGTTGSITIASLGFVCLLLTPVLYAQAPILYPQENREAPGLAGPSAAAPSPSPDISGPPTGSIEHLQQQLDKQAIQIECLQAALANQSNDQQCTSSTVDSGTKPRYLVTYDNGFVFRPVDKAKSPYEMRITGWAQLRHHAFDRDIQSWTDNGGITRSVQNRNEFDIERARLIFSGFVVDPRLTYFCQLDGDTDGGHLVDFLDYFWAWEFSESFQLQMGKRKVPGSRQWQLRARDTRFIERPMSDDFFRPDRTVGIWGVGSISESTRYELMVGNGYNTANLPNSDSDNRFTYGATAYIDPWGDFGRSLVDHEMQETPLARIGHSFVFSPQTSRQLGVPLEEATFARLTDGTRLTQPGALAPGVTVSDFDVYLYNVDAAFKFLGWSANSELFMRWFEDLKASGPLPQSAFFQHGFYVEGGRFLIPQTFDINARYSQVSSEFGNGSELAIGCNWFPLKSYFVKVSFDVTQLDSSPVQSTSGDILVGDDGTLFRSQFQAEF